MWLFRPRLRLGFGKSVPDGIIPLLDKPLLRISDKAAALRLRDGVQLTDGTLYNLPCLPVTDNRQTREIVESTIRKLDAIPEPECRRFIADMKQRFIQKRDNSIRRRLAEAKEQTRTEKPHPKRKEPDRERS